MSQKRNRICSTTSVYYDAFSDFAEMEKIESSTENYDRVEVQEKLTVLSTNTKSVFRAFKMLWR